MQMYILRFLTLTVTLTLTLTLTLSTRVHYGPHLVNRIAAWPRVRIGVRVRVRVRFCSLGFSCAGYIHAASFSM